MTKKMELPADAGPVKFTAKIRDLFSKKRGFTHVMVLDTDDYVHKIAEITHDWEYVLMIVEPDPDSYLSVPLNEPPTDEHIKVFSDAYMQAIQVDRKSHAESLKIALGAVYIQLLNENAKKFGE